MWIYQLQSWLVDCDQTDSGVHIVDCTLCSAQCVRQAKKKEQEAINENHTTTTTFASFIILHSSFIINTRIAIWSACVTQMLVHIYSNPRINVHFMCGASERAKAMERMKELYDLACEAHTHDRTNDRRADRPNNQLNVVYGVRHFTIIRATTIFRNCVCVCVCSYEVATQ